MVVMDYYLCSLFHVFHSAIFLWHRFPLDVLIFYIVSPILIFSCHAMMYVLLNIAQREFTSALNMILPIVSVALLFRLVSPGLCCFVLILCWFYSPFSSAVSFNAIPAAKHAAKMIKRRAMGIVEIKQEMLAFCKANTTDYEVIHWESLSSGVDNSIICLVTLIHSNLSPV